MQRIAKAGLAEQTINKSRFIALAEYCQNERAVGQALRRFAAGHQGAHHLAYAFRLKTEQGIVQRFHDAGEPSGTAGKPILQCIEGRDLINICVGVIRYYGGVNLGTGGLARAYGGTAKLALDAASVITFVEMQRIQLTLSYNMLDQFTREVGKMNGEILDKQFNEGVTVLAMVPSTDAPGLLQRFTKP